MGALYQLFENQFSSGTRTLPKVATRTEESRVLIGPTHGKRRSAWPGAACTWGISQAPKKPPRLTEKRKNNSLKRRTYARRTDL